MKRYSLCAGHYQRMRMGKSLTGPLRSNLRNAPLAERFWLRVDRGDDEGCWLWTGYVQANGYGKFTVSETGRCWAAHRLSWFLTHGAEPTHELDHLCMVKRCVNPAHLEDVPHPENQRRSWASPTHKRPAVESSDQCRHGHTYTAENTYRPPHGGYRQCRQCRSTAMRRRGLRRLALG